MDARELALAMLLEAVEEKSPSHTLLPRIIPIRIKGHATFAPIFAAGTIAVRNFNGKYAFA